MNEPMNLPDSPEIGMIVVDQAFLDNMVPAAVEMFELYEERINDALDSPNGYTERAILLTIMEDGLTADENQLLNPAQRMVGDSLLQAVFLLEHVKRMRGAK